MPDPIISDQNPVTQPPAFPEMTDIPQMPTQIQQDTTATTIPPTTNVPTDTTQTPPLSQPMDIPPIITDSKPAKKKKTGMIATILGIFLLIGAVGAGVVLINQNQDIREKAAILCPKDCATNISQCKSGTQVGGIGYGDCGMGEYCCEIITPPPPDCSVYYTKTATSLTIKDPYFPNCYINHYWCSDGVGDPYTGCSDETIAVGVKSASFIKDCGIEQIDYGCTNNSCKDFVSHLGKPCAPTPPPSDITAACTYVKAYDENWNLLTTADLSSLSAGDIVRFTVSGNPAASIDKARFTINGVVGTETTDKKPGTNEYYTEYTIPGGVTSFTITAQIHHVTLNWF